VKSGCTLPLPSQRIKINHEANKAHKGKDFTENLVPGAFALPGTPAALTLLSPHGRLSPCGKGRKKVTHFL
jgi:hypothetical protein